MFRGLRGCRGCVGSWVGRCRETWRLGFLVVRAWIWCMSVFGACVFYECEFAMCDFKRLVITHECFAMCVFR
jgi:hypothetical protein